MRVVNGTARYVLVNSKHIISNENIYLRFYQTKMRKIFSKFTIIVLHLGM